MNKKICQKICPKFKNKISYLILTDNLHGKFVPFIVSYNKNYDKKTNHFLYDDICELKKVNTNIITTIFDLHPKEDCPYKIEHDLYDWNKKK